MIQANELRLGNFIYKIGLDYVMGNPIADYNDKEVVEVDLDVIENVLKFNNTTDYELYEPIPLTEEYLLRFGFEKTMEWTYSKKLVGNLKLVYYLGEKGWSIGFKNYSDFSNLTYIHQLQNLYFALTGEELTLKTEL